jgi:hypothetical protein
MSSPAGTRGRARLAGDARQACGGTLPVVVARGWGRGTLCGAGGASRCHRCLKLCRFTVCGLTVCGLTGCGRFGRFVGRRPGSFGELPGRARVRLAAPRAVACPVGRVMSFEHQLCIAPEQAVDHFRRFPGLAVDGHRLPHFATIAPSALTAGNDDRQRVATVVAQCVRLRWSIYWGSLW